MASTLGPLPLSASRVPRLSSALRAAPKLPLGPEDRPLHPYGRRAPGRAVRGPGQQPGAPSGRAPPGTRGRATHLVAQSRPAAGLTLAPGPGSWRRRRRWRRLLLQEGAESSDFLLKGQLPLIDHTQRASSRQHPSQPRSLPPCLRPWWLVPRRVHSGGGRGRAPGSEAGLAPSTGAAPMAGSPGSPSQPSPAAPRSCRGPC